MAKLPLLPVKPFQETLHGGFCGPASLKMVLDYYGVKQEEDRLAQLCGKDSVLGVDALSIKKVAEKYGFTVEIQNNSSYQDITNWLSQKVPLIVNWMSRGRIDYPESAVPDGHYSVVVGLDQNQIYLQDPEIGHLRTVSRYDFMRSWYDFTGDCINSWNEIILRQLIAIYKQANNRASIARPLSASRV